MSANELREAARLIRERAEAATPAPWASWVEGRDGFGGDDIIVTTDGDLYIDLHPGQHTVTATRVATQDHIASWHPAVALAVADWLDDIARWIDFGDSGGERNVAHALAVARAYLGTEATA